MNAYGFYDLFKLSNKITLSFQLTNLGYSCIGVRELAGEPPTVIFSTILIGTAVATGSSNGSGRDYTSCREATYLRRMY